jgi:hypothetical protein
MTALSPSGGVGARISGSTPGGGQITPSDRASLSPNGSPDRPVVWLCGAIVPSRGAACVGTQFPSLTAADGAAREGAAGNCASAAAGRSASIPAKIVRFMHMGFKTKQCRTGSDMRYDPQTQRSRGISLCDNASAKSAPSEASACALAMSRHHDLSPN